MPAPQSILELVERFKNNEESYRRGYGETETRRELIDPLFRALGWDIDNSEGNADAYKDVVHEDSVRVAGKSKAPDYAFRIGGTRKFFVEAKRPGIRLKDDADAAFQVRRYAWSAKLPLSIATNFAEFSVYDCRDRPAVSDRASKGRLLYVTWEEYHSRWHEIESVFSKESIYKGSFDKFAAAKARKGTAQVDDAFLAEIEGWRSSLARNIALRNPGLAAQDLNFSVQQTIDRIIFLRICEDRGIEPYGRLRGLLDGDQVYGRLFVMFQAADNRYNSGLFHFSVENNRHAPDVLTPGLSIDDKVLKDVVRSLYYPESPYEFSVLPADILGQVYEQFLGKVIRLTATGQAKVEDKPEVKKSKGVYYTPTYIVEYIVKETLGRFLETQTPKAISDILVLDPACGSGSFLLGAYQHLLNWHRDWYVADGADKHARGRTPKIFRGEKGEWRLTINERKRILLNNIYGVDIDPQAVEVTKLSLLLKVLEDESGEALGRTWEMFHERALPDLDDNIKCGNSLVGPEYFDGMVAPAPEELAKVNPFSWETEFPRAFTRRRRGFDVVIGNPPYVRQESLLHVKEYLERHYESFSSSADLFTYFMERALKLLAQSGRFSYVVSSSFLRTTYAQSLRTTLKKYGGVERIVDFGGLAVFAKAKDTYVCIPVLQKSKQPDRVLVTRVPSLGIKDVAAYAQSHSFSIPESRLTAEAWSLRSDGEFAVFQKLLSTGQPLLQYIGGQMHYGVKTGLNEAFIIDTPTRNQLIEQDRNSADVIHPVLSGEDVRRYRFNETDRWLIFTRRGINLSRYPAVRAHLSKWRAELTPKRTKSEGVGRKPGSYAWYEIQDDVAYFQAFERPKILFPDICKSPRFAIDRTGHYLTNTGYILASDDPFLLGVLNSKLFWFVISNISIPFGVRAGKFRYRLIAQYMEKVPIRDVARGDALWSTRAAIAKLAEEMSELAAAHASIRSPHELAALERRISRVDAEIDERVFHLYGLSATEAKVVQDSVSGLLDDDEEPELNEEAAQDEETADA
jgi:hypothetical protein